MNAPTPVDVLIVGGGLAGLCLALQLRARCPGLAIRMHERRAGPALAGALAGDAARDARGLAVESLCAAAGNRARPVLFTATAWV